MKKVRTRASRVWSMLLVVAMLLTMLPTVAFAAESPQTIYVNASNQGTAPDGSENNPYTEIAAAVEAADDGDTIKVVAVEGYEYEPFELANLENLTIEGISDTYGNKPVIKTNYAESPVTVYQGCGAVVPGLGMDGLRLIGLEFKNYGYSDAWYSSSIALNGNTGANVSGAVIDSCDFTVAENAPHKPNYAAFLNTDTFTFTNNKVVGYNNGVVCMADGSTLNTVTITGNTFNVTTNALYLYNGKYDSNAPGTIIFTDNTMLSGQIELWDYANSRVGQEDGGSSSIKTVITDVDTSEVPIITTAIDQGDTSFKTEDGNAINNVVFNYEDAKQALKNTSNGDSFYIGYSADKGEGNTLYTKTAIDEYEDENGTVYNSWAAKLSSTNRTYDTIEDAVAKANDGDTLTISAGTHTITNAPLTISKRINLVGAGADKTTIVGTVKYQLAAVTENENAALSVSGINFTAGEDALQGLVFTGTVNTEQRVDISVSDCAFNGWTYGIAMHSHVNGSTLTVSDNEFNTWCGINFNKDPDNKFGQVADNTLNISTGNTFNCSYAVEEFDNGNAAGSDAVAEDNYYETAKDYVDGTPVAGDIIRVTNATELQKAINDAGTTAATIELAGNITLSNVIIVPRGANITIEGNGNTISYPVASPKVAFTGAGDGVQQEGIPEDVTLTINDVIFQNTTAGAPAGYAVLLDFNADGTKVILTGCTFENLYCGVYVNPVTEATITPPTISITNSTYTNTTYGYSVDEVTNGAIVGGVETIFTGNTGVENEAETWYNVVATVTSGDVTKAYQSWEAAFDEATAGDTITLQQDIAGPITINKTITLEGNGKTITAEEGDAIIVTAAGVTLNEVNATAEGKNALGHALVVGAEDSAVKGTVTVNGGTYVAKHTGMQGEGAIRIFASGDVTVKDVTTTGGIHVFNPGTYEISGNNVSFDGYQQDGVGILVFYDKLPDGINPQAVADSIMRENVIVVPTENSDYVQIVVTLADGTWDFPGKISATNSVAKIDNNYYNTLQAAVDAVGSNETITLLKNCNENITVSREVTFIIENGENSFTGSVSAGNGYRVTENNGIYIVEKYTPSSSGGGGGGSVTTYAITVEDSENGQVEANRTSASRGSSITLTVTPDEGYELSSLTVTDADGNEIEVTENDGTYRFTMPSSKVTVTAEFTESSENPGTPEEPGTTEMPFTDVASTDWYYDAVAYAYENDLMNGISSTQFNPNGTTTRGMIATILYRLEGEPEAPACDFTDVAAGQYYTDAIAWAAENHLVNGYGDGTFGPNDNITREQMSALLYRYAEFKGYDLTASGDLSGYTDASQISDYAVTAMQWATAEGLVNGMGDGTLAPRGNSTRAQIATILMRFLENIA